MGKERQPTYHKLDSSPLGRALALYLRPATRLTWVGAGWAALCGILAAGVPHPSVGTAAQVLLTLALADAVLGAAWERLYKACYPSPQGAPDPAQNDVAPVADGQISLEPRVIRSRAATATRGSAAQGTVATQSRQPGATALQLATRASLKKRTIFASRQYGLEIGLLWGLALLLGLTLGRGVAVIVALGLLFPLITWFALGRDALLAGGTRAVLEIGFPWAIGLAAFTPFPPTDLGGLSGLTLSTVMWANEQTMALTVGLLFIIAHAGQLALDQPLRFAKYRGLVNLPQFIGVTLLVIWQQPILAGLAALLVLGQMLFQPHLYRYDLRWYLRSTQWMFMGVMLATALGVAGYGG